MKFLSLVLLAAAFSFATPAARATTIYVCAVTNGSYIFDARGPTASSAKGYANLACRNNGLGSCQLSACKSVQEAKMPNPATAIIGVYNVATGETQTFKKTTRPAARVPARAPRGMTRQPAPSSQSSSGGHCSATSNDAGQSFRCSSLSRFGPAVCGNNGSCLWVEPGDSSSCVPKDDRSAWFLCSSLTRFGPAVCEHDERCIWPN